MDIQIRYDRFLYDVIDPDALNALFQRDKPTGESTLRVEFSFNGFRIVVQDGPSVAVHLEGVEG